MNRSILTDARVPLIVACLALSGIVLSIHSTGRMYPWALVALFVGLAVLVVLAVGGASFWSVLSGGITLGVGYRLALNHFTTPIGTSPQIQPGRMDDIVETGSAAASGTGFYGDAPLHFLVGAVSAIVFDVSAYESILSYAILIGVLLPLVVICLCRYVGIRDRRALVVAALLAVCTTEAIRRSYWIIPQTTGSIFWWLTVMVLTRHVTNRDKRLYGILALFATAIVITHKLPIAVLLGIIIALLLLIGVDKLTWDDIGQLTPARQLLLLGTFIGSLTLVQWLYVGPLLPNVVTRTQRIFTETGATDSGPSAIPPSGSVEALPGITAYFVEYPSVLSLFIERGHGLWLVLVAGFGWLYFFSSGRKHRSAVQVVLAAAAIGVALLPIGVVAIRGLNPTRILILIEPILVVLVVGVLWWARDIGTVLASFLQKLRHGARPSRPATDGGRKPQVRLGSIAVTVIFVLLIASQVFATSAAPDYANSPRYYADVPEAYAETTLCQYTDERVYGDDYFARFTDSTRGDCSAISAIGMGADSPLFDNNITTQDHQMVAYRTNVDVYLGAGGTRWRLTWDPETSMATEYNKIYANDAVVAFRAPESEITDVS